MCTILGAKTDWLYPLLILENEENKIKFMQFYAITSKHYVKEQQKFWTAWLSVFCENDQNGEITAREYVMLLRIILYMDEILEKGLCIMSRAFSSVHGKCAGEEMKPLLIEMLHKKSKKAYKEIFANVFLFYYKHVTKPFYLKKKS